LKIQIDNNEFLFWQKICKNFMQFYFLETVNESAEEIFIHLAKEQEAIEDLNIPEEEKLAMEEKLEDNLLNNVDDEIIEAVQGNNTINNIGDLQDVVETYSEKLDAIESLDQSAETLDELKRLKDISSSEF
jgi:hypothetical protein